MIHATHNKNTPPPSLSLTGTEAELLENRPIYFLLVYLISVIFYLFYVVAIVDPDSIPRITHTAHIYLMILDSVMVSLTISSEVKGFRLLPIPVAGFLSILPCVS